MSTGRTGPNPLFLREEELRRAMELLICANRDFTAEADRVLAAHGLGRAHYRILYFVARYPGISVGELLGILRVTKQSLSRALAELVARGLVGRQADARDRRRRLLRLTEEGAAVEEKVSESQRRRIARAFREAGADAVEGFRKVLLGLVDQNDRRRLEGAA